MTEKLKSLNMCDFCALDISTCQAKPIKLSQFGTISEKSLNLNAVIVCNKYVNPVEILQKKFHDFS